MTPTRFSLRPIYLLAIVLALSITETASAQRVWSRGNSEGEVSGLSAVYMRDSLDGWAVGSQGLILRTSDAGESWADVSLDSNFQLNDVTFIDEMNGVIVGGVLLPDQTWGPIALRTRDGGRSWQQGVVNEPWGALFEVIADSGKLAAVMHGALYVSQDSGTTWRVEFLEQRGAFGPIVWDLFMTPAGDPYVFARDGLVYRATDDITRWEYVGGLGSGSEYGSFDAFGVPTPDIMLMLGNAGQIYRSTDGGAHWTDVARIDSRYWADYWRHSGARFHFPDERNGMLVLPDGMMYVTSDTGATWTKTTIPSFVSGSCFPSRSRGYIVSASRIYKTTDGGESWQPKSRAYGVDFTSVASVKWGDTTVWYATAEKGTIASSNDGGRNWYAEFTGTLRRLNAVAFTADLTGYVVGDSGMILRRDGSSLWVPLPGTMPEWNLDAVYAIDARNVFAAGYDNQTRRGRMVHTTDGGAHWEIVSLPAAGPLHDLLFVDGSIGYAVGDDETVLQTLDGGRNWTRSPLTGVGSSAAWSYASVHFIDRNNGMISGRTISGGVTLQTTDGGISWQRVDSAGMGGEQKVVRMHSPSQATVMTSTGTIITTDGGATWQQERVFDDDILSDMDFAPSGAGVIVGLRSAVHYTRGSISGIEEERRPWRELSGPMLW